MTEIPVTNTSRIQILIAVFVFVAFCTVTIGIISYTGFKKEFRSDVENNLNAISNLKVAEIVQWRKERLGDGSVFAGNQFFYDLVNRFIASPSDPELNDRLRTWLGQVRSAYTYERVLLLDASGNELISEPKLSEPVTSHLINDINISVKTQKVTFLDFHRDAPDGPVYLGVLAPVLNPWDPDKPIAVLVFVINPEIYLYPLINTWPSLSRTAETLLLRRDGDSVLFLNELRFQKNSALSLRFSLNNNTLPAAKAVLGYDGIFTGIDYRGVQVLSSLKKIPDSPWFMVARIDVREVYAPLRARWWTMFIIVVLLILSFISLIYIFWRRQKILFYREKYEAEKEKVGAIKALAESERKFHETVKYLDEGYYSVTPDGLLLDHNQAFNRILGFDIFKDMKGSNLPDFWQSPEERKAYLKELMTRGSIMNYLINAKKSDDEKIVVLANAHLIKNEKGEPLRIEGTFTDFTELKLAEDKLSTQYTLLKALINSPDDLIVFSVDKNYCYTAFNEKHRMEMKNVWNTDIEIGMNLLNCMSIPELRKSAKQSIDRVLTGKVFSEIQSQTNKSTYYEFNWNPVYQDYKVTGATVFIRDISERKKAEGALIESERKLKEAQEMAHLGFWHWDIKSGNVEWSDEVFKIFYLDPKEFTPHIDSILTLSPWPEDHQRDKELINLAIETHSPGSYEQKFLRPDQSIGHYYSTFQGNFNENGDLISIVGTVLDITERKKAEEAIQILNKELEQRVIERTSQLEAANKELEAFAYSVSHDLRAPLRAVDGFSKFVIEDYGNKLDTEGNRMLGLIRSNTQKMDQLITDLLNLSRVSRRDLQYSEIDMTKLALSMFNESVPGALKDNIKLKIDKLPEAFADPVFIKQVWINLLSNAIKFTSKKRKPKIRISGKIESLDVIYSIEDNGAGFNQHYVSKLFGVFQRLHKSDDFEGTGVGLAIVQRIIHRHCGKVWAEGVEGEGATFYFSLPVKQHGSKSDLSLIIT